MCLVFRNSILERLCMNAFARRWSQKIQTHRILPKRRTSTNDRLRNLDRSNFTSKRWVKKYGPPCQTCQHWIFFIALVLWWTVFHSSASHQLLTSVGNRFGSLRKQIRRTRRWIDLFQEKADRSLLTLVFFLLLPLVSSWMDQRWSACGVSSQRWICERARSNRFSELLYGTRGISAILTWMTVLIVFFFFRSGTLLWVRCGEFGAFLQEWSYPSSVRSRSHCPIWIWFLFFYLIRFDCCDHSCCTEKYFDSRTTLLWLRSEHLALLTSDGVTVRAS